MLRERIINEFNALREQPEMIQNVMGGMQRRAVFYFTVLSHALIVIRLGALIERSGTGVL